MLELQSTMSTTVYEYDTVLYPVHFIYVISTTFMHDF
jgi:hypothetical protein